MAPAALKDGPDTWVSIWIHVGSASLLVVPVKVGSVMVTQSTILRSPVDVVCRAGFARSTPLSTMAIVVPRPSQVGCAWTNWAAPVSPIGM